MLIIDSAHWIRNSSSKQFRAVSSLSASRRWCLTGTPIQNRLEELASLAAFLQLSPFASKAEFQKNILTPLCEGGPDFSKPFRTWIQAYCLRRTEKHLNLPPSSEHTLRLNPSAEEQSLFQDIRDQTRREIDDRISRANCTRKHNILFTALLRMRMLCNRGTLAVCTSGSLASVGRIIECERCSSVSEDDAVLFESVAFCPDCGRPLRLSSPSSEGALSPRADLKMRPDLAFQGGSLRPHSTKLSAVVENIANSSIGTKQSVDPPVCVELAN